MMRNTPPQVVKADKIDYLKPLQYNIGCNMPVYLLKGTSQDVIRIEFVFRSGSINQKKLLVAQSVANLLRSGTQKRNAEEINHLLDYYGASLQVEAEKDIISISVACLAKHIRPILGLLIEMVSDAVFPDEEISVFLNNQLQNYIVDMKTVSHVARVHFNSMIFGENHPYGIFAKEDDFKAVVRDDITDYYNRFIHPANALCIITGSYPNDIIEMLEENINDYSWRPKELIDTVWNDPNATTPQKRTIDMEGKVQSAIRVGKTTINRYHPDYHKLSITNTLLGGFFGSRLMQNIRQDKGYTYGIGSGVVSLLHSAYFFISSQVGKEVCDNTLDEIYKELRNLRQNPAETREMTMLINYLSASFLRSFDGPFSQSGRFRELVIFGLDYTYYDNYFHTLNSLKPGDIQSTAEQFFHENDMSQIVVG